MHLNKISSLLLTIIIVLVTVNCDDDDSHPVPNVAVHITINTDQPSYSDLRVTGGWLYVTGGAEGIIVYRRSKDTFMAYDRYCDERSCGRAYVDTSTNTQIFCDCDSTVYSITDGTVTSGSAEYPLKRYNTSFDGDNILKINN